VPDSLNEFKAEFFKALSHPARVTILELLKGGELSVTDLQDRLGIESSSVSQHLSVLRQRNIVASRKVATTVYYRLRYPEVFELFDVIRRIFNNQLKDTRLALEELESDREANSQTMDKEPALSATLT
jgi:DNA-binding transcriptional ArsR family regulator